MIFDTRLVSVWSDLLPLVQRIMNTHIVSTIGVSPAQIIFGNAIDLDRNFVPIHVLNQPEERVEESYKNYMNNLIKNQLQVIQAAQDHLFDNDQKRLDRQRKDGAITEFPIGSIVLAQYPDKGLGARAPTKFNPKWEGPFRVVTPENNGGTSLCENRACFVERS